MPHLRPVGGGAGCLTDVEKPPTDTQPQAAELSDFEVDLVVPALADELEDVDVDESEDELTDSLEGAEVLVVPEPRCESSPECLPECLPEPPREVLPEFQRESLRESLR